MRREIFKGSFLTSLRVVLVPFLFSLAVVLMVYYGLSQAEKASRSEGARILEESLVRAAVKCYAVEGSYPKSLEDMQERYGVVVDSERYRVYYEVFASNILPDITVIERSYDFK